MKKTDKYSVTLPKYVTPGLEKWEQAMKATDPDNDPKVSRLIARYVKEGLIREGYLDANCDEVADKTKNPVLQD